jgi:glycerol-3-phosphate acyltransferase PlsX
MTEPKQTKATPRVAVDAMGGDFGLTVAVAGALDARRELDVQLELVGPRALVEQELARAGAPAGAIGVVDAPDVVEMAEKISRATLKKRSSMLVGLERVRDGQADAFFSAGNTAACWTIAKLVLGALEEVDRPALAAVVPNRVSRTVLIDVGANAACKARHLEEFAVMGAIYSQAVLHTPEPRGGLMSVGEEETKGNELTREVHEVLKDSALNFVGNVEGHDLFSGKVDVVVMDGFTGNVALKASETLAESIMHLLREEIERSSPFARLGALMARGAFRAVRKRIDPAEYGGAPLLGVKGCCVIGHGKSQAYAIKHGIRAAAEFYRSGVNQQIEAELRALAARRDAAGARAE